MVVNNWFVTIDMYQDVVGAHTYPKVFFVSFWCFVALILMNVVIALILEIYSSVEPEVARKCKQIDLTVQLAKMVEGLDRETIKGRFTEVRRQLEQIEEEQSSTNSFRSQSFSSSSATTRTEERVSSIDRS